MIYYVVDAFADKIFKGNPAGVCICDKKLSDELMQNIAAENNLSETAFVYKNGDVFDLKWFTPECEIDLCGHATLAAAFVIMNYIDNDIEVISFSTLSGKLTVKKENNLFLMDFPKRIPKSCPIPDGLEKALGVTIKSTYYSRDLIVVLKNEKTVKELSPDFQLLSYYKDYFGIAVTAKGNDCDFVSRYFAPLCSINEDPVTGSSHSSLIPYWSEKLRKNAMVARQLSKRGGTLLCKQIGNRVEIGGEAVLYSKGEILI